MQAVKAFARIAGLVACVALLSVSHARAAVFTNGSENVLAASGDDFTIGPREIGFSFPFFGAVHTQVHVNSNGNLSFGAGDTTFANFAFPHAGLPVIAAFFDDLTYNPGSILENTSVPNSYVVTWNGAAHYNAGGSFTFQVILLGAGNGFGGPAGGIIFNYGDISPGSSPTIGLSAGDGWSQVSLGGLLGTAASGTMSGDQASALLPGTSYTFGPTYVVTPEPSTYALLLLGGAALWLARRRRNRG